MMNKSPTDGNRKSQRPTLGSATVSILTAVYLLLITNRTFWTKALTYFPDTRTVALLAVGLVALASAIFIAVSFKYITKPFLIFMVIAAASASWFMDGFGTIIDREMVRNAVTTTPAEAGHLVTFGFIKHMVLFGVIPVGLLLWVNIEHKTIGRKLKTNLGLIALMLAITAGAGLTEARTLSATSRAHRDLLATLNPFTPIVQVARYFIGTAKVVNVVVEKRGLDAQVNAPVSANAKPRVLVVVAGETARAESFALGGYSRDTNPELSKLDITYFPKTTSCGTATAVSIPCMFSVFGRKDYSFEKGISNENLVDILAHSGIRTEWWENNTGSKGVADRITFRSFSNENDPRFCVNRECRDEVILANLDTWLDSVKGDAVLVVHQLGSHGPAYYQRYGEERRRFTPDCRTDELGNCSREEIVNAYDNSILETDHFLATIIDKLKARETSLAGSMIYMSDHGESLGEKGLYLHGAPYFVAPSQQTHIPFVLWLGQDTKKTVDAGCLTAKTAEDVSHDNLYSTVLGLMYVTTKEYKHDLDVLAACRSDVKS